MSFQVTAILAAYNEEDIVGAALAHLAAQGVRVYFIDHGSTDGTLAEARRFEGRSVIGVEQLPAGETVRWADVLRRKEELARELPGDWFIHHDADEFRESPWSGTTLSEGIRRVDALGYNAIDFEVLQFRPTHDNFKKGDDPLASFPYYEAGLEYDKLQIKCWKRTAGAALAASGGHDVDFPGRRVFPVRFLLRHYPIRTQAQGTRKIFRERRPRFDAQEQARGWHRQYAAAHEGESLLRDPASLTAWDGDAVRTHLWLEHRGVEELRAQLDQARADAAIREPDLQWFRREWPAREAELNAARESLQTASASLEAARTELGATRADLKTTRSDLTAARTDLESARSGLNAAHLELEVARADLTEALSELEAARAEIERLQESQAAAGELQSALRSADAELQSLRATATHLEGVAQARQARIEDLLASWSWRTTSAARAALKRLRGY